ncbi:MAG: ATP-binding cassette domain-containing protein [Planctomycetota bacterium]|nr:ATP-binding cassette domain-containing protein [Planctomycetota bacterium]
MSPPLLVRIAHEFRSAFRLEIEFEHPLSEFHLTALMGASGSGKTTVLRSLAGLERPDSGTIRFGEEIWFDSVQGTQTSPQRRGVGCLFQDYALFPHRNVADNIGFGLKGVSVRDRQDRVAELLSMLQLAGIERRYPRELSGGQQQRVALARAVASRPKLLLLDEPLSALDTPTRRELRGLIREFLKSQQIPALLVTHDPNDVRSLADRVVVLDAGRVLQTGSVDDVIACPATRRVEQLLARDADVLESA